ncbi:hypothetical protein AVEN_116351-1 [Araneus ventricosus]|uniref:Uncharacterized protein n=1 Tax=Araneus ventricosus TaxID=182803 RepID=A0A4Y2KPM1_ARAVE|nr:hypothetical protein AVEN_116351-1 [Araneus ventricosus]
MPKCVEGKMTNLSTLIQELVVLPECHLPFLQLTGTPGENEQFIHLNFLTLTLIKTLTQKSSIMKNTSFAVSKVARNWDSSVLCTSSGPIPPVMAKTKSEPMAMQFL